MDQSQPAQGLWELINLHTVARCLHIVAEAGVADALQDKPMPVVELATQTDLNADALDRMLRLLASYGVFERMASGYAHSPASKLLRSDHPQSLRSFARMIGMPLVWNGFTTLGHAGKTGKPMLDWSGMVAYFSNHQEEASLFNDAMAAKSSAVIPAIVEAFDFEPFKVIADIGGGRGHLLSAILERVPALSGILFELPHVIADATGVVSPRLKLVPGSFFSDPLPVADAYVLMEVIHDWDDADAEKILAAVRQAAPRHARMLVVEALVADVPGPHHSKVLDIIMLAVTGGRERTPTQYQALLQRAGWRLERIISTRSQYSIVEASTN